MKRAILIDGNNLIFRSYYATAYTGNTMKNSKGFPTNALYGFINMINKIMNEEKPEYVIVAFDKGKSFRHELYKDYKDGRIETPKELIAQFPYSRKVLEYMGIKYLELDNYEADDIIGTFAKMADEDHLYDATIISSDKDLLQLISSDVDVKLLKQKDYIKMNEETFFETYGIKPIRIIDLKALEGDPSDNIPGVKGIGEKTALSLLQKYDTLENVYEHIDDIKGKLQEKLINDKDNAFFSKKLATIYKDIELDLTFEDIKVKEADNSKLKELYEELEFFSFLKNIKEDNKQDENIEYQEIKKGDKLNLKDISLYIELDGINYHRDSIIGIGIYDGNKSYYLDPSLIKENESLFNEVTSTFDLKKNIVSLNRIGIKTNIDAFDTMIASYLLEYNKIDDVSYLSNIDGYNIPFYENIISKKELLTKEEIKKAIVLKAKYLYESKEKYIKELKDNNIYDLFSNIELPLVNVLASMEMEGIRVDKSKLMEMNADIKIKLDSLTNSIYNLAGESFNISSPKQLGDILFVKLGLPYRGKKGKYSTAHETIFKLKDIHPIINMILEYKELNKLYTTYMSSLSDYILEDGKIHTIYKQTIARTGRLSSIEPNLQNIPVRSDEGRKIRKAFIPSNNSLIMSSDYSQIELRVLAHISKDKNLIEAFNNGEDIHTHVAADIFDIDEIAVTKNMRRTAKAVIFGIVYGISGYGLGENLDLPAKEAKKYIDKYLSLYPSVNDYMKEIVIEAKDKGYVTTLFNRKRTIEELNNTNYMIRQSGERIALNTPIQGTSADIIKKAMIDVYNEFTKHNLSSKMILQVHDELIFDVLESEKEMVKEIVTNIMENTYKLDVPLKVEVDFGKDWYDAK